ncbi:MAG: sulfatase-like hydrolase/transferase [Pirellulales bacterium]
MTDESLKFIDANASKPFFLHLAHYGVHTPLKAPAETTAKYASWDGVPHGKQENPIYAAMLEHVDRSVGRIVEKLEQLQLLGRTLIIFTSDNGGLATIEGPNTPATSNAPLREGKGWLYEGGIRVPLIVHAPEFHQSPPSRRKSSNRLQRGIAVRSPVWSCDILPTILQFTGVSEPQNLDGHSLMSELRGEEPQSSRELYWHYPHYSNQGGKPGGAVRIGNWKLIEHYESGRHELFDLSAGPNESRNLAAENPRQAEILAESLKLWRQRTGARMPTPNPDYVPNLQAADGSITLPAHGRRSWRATALRAFAAQKYARLLDESRRLRDA